LALRRLFMETLTLRWLQPFTKKIAACCKCIICTY
jgi:hypothetical protein